MYPRQSPSTHTEQLGDEVAVYDWARTQVHALNPTAACVWRQCDGVTSSDAIAAALHQELGIPEAAAVVDLTLTQLASLHLLALPVESRDDRPGTTRRWLLARGVAAVMLPAVYSIVAPSPLEAQSPAPPAAPTLTAVSPNQGNPGDTLVVTLTGTNFVVGATAVVAGGGGVTVTNVEVGSTTSLTANFVIDPAAAIGARTVTVTTTGGTSDGQTFTISVSTGSTTFGFTGSPAAFTVPAGVVSIAIQAEGAPGGHGGAPIGGGGRGGRTTATVSVTPGASLTVRVGGSGPDGVGNFVTPGAFNGGGGSAGDGGGGGGASSVHDGATALVIAGGGGGGGSGIVGGGSGGNGGGGGGLTANPGDPGLNGGGGGGGGSQTTGGVAGTPGDPGNIAATAGTAGTGGAGGSRSQPGVFGGGGGGGGYFGGGGGGGGGAEPLGTSGQPSAGGGGGGSSFTAPGATGVAHTPGVTGAGVTISW